MLREKLSRNYEDSTVIDLLTHNLKTNPNHIPYVFLDFPKRNLTYDQKKYSWQEIYDSASNVANYLSQSINQGETVIVAFRHGDEFLIHFLGCLLAGVVAVPSPIPKMGFGMERLASIYRNCNAKAIITNESSVATIEKGLGEDSVQFITPTETASLPNSDFIPADVSFSDTAFIQYSSGSTGTPKGIAITHRNILNEFLKCENQLYIKPGCKFVSWLPFYHDMGLLFGYLQPIYTQCTNHVFSPDEFVQKPARWFQVLSDFRASHTVAPNFSYDLAVKLVTDEEIASFDLSELHVAGNAAEPIRAQTLDDFAARFASTGFKKESFHTGYGLAESTLLVATKGERLVVSSYDKNALEDNRVVPVAEGAACARRLVSSGVACGDSQIRIVDPVNGNLCEANKVGEIWVKGNSVGNGYWNNETLTNEIFLAKTDSDDDSCYLRTGDLGFLDNKELFVCGRIKDLILLHGKNHHPSDIEATISHFSKQHPVNQCVAFSASIDELERLIVVCELDRKSASISEDSLEKLSYSIADKIVEQHQISPHAILYVKRGIPKTTSGKVQRNQCKERYLSGELNVVYNLVINELPAVSQPTVNPTTVEDATDSEKKASITTWLEAQFKTHSGDNAQVINDKTSLLSLNFSQQQQALIKQDIEKEFALYLPNTLFGEYQTIGDLAEFLATIDISSNKGKGLSIEELRQQQANGSVKHEKDEPIAIIGIGCRFPDANNPEEFWQNIVEKRNSVTQVPEARWDIDAVYDKNSLANGKMNTRSGGFLKNIKELDRNFFGYSVRETTRMDPAHRLMLEVSWEAMENSGLLANQLTQTKTGVFVGISGSDYSQLQFSDENLSDAYVGLGSALTNAASRVSHFLDLRGPAMAIDTACSSSLSSVHLACNSIRNGDCEMALAGGVNLVISPAITMSLSKAGMMSPDGQCKTFDASANGYVRSEGAGVVLLKPLSQAIADGNYIHAVIKGSASNHDGRSSGLSAPNGEAQQRVIMQACNNAGIQPGELTYVEAHGTGTPLGDPIEVNALAEVLSIGAKENTHCAIGSVKTNIGHSESAAGIASIIKVTKMLSHKTLPPSLHFNNPNPQIPFDDIRVKVQTELTQLEDNDAPVYMGVNSFGIGGTNVHIVLEAFQGTEQGTSNKQPETQTPKVLPLSAKSIPALKNIAKSVISYLDHYGSNADLNNICHTLSYHRTHMENRFAAVGDNTQDIIAQLEEFSSVNKHVNGITGYSRTPEEQAKIAFVFSGQGAQYWSMGKALFETESVYRDFFVRCDKALQEYFDWSLIDVVLAGEEDERLKETVYAQPSLFACQCALAHLLMSWGVNPGAVIGHSVGEISAAYISGNIDFDNAILLIANRAKIMQQATGNGKMVSVELSLKELTPYLADYSDGVSIAAINGPQSIVVSGNSEQVDKLVTQLTQQGVMTLPLGVNYAFHSPLMETYKQELVALLDDLSTSKPAIKLVSTVEGDYLAEGSAMTATYWGDNLREKVNFHQGIETLIDDGFTTFVEISPHAVLKGVIGRTLKAKNELGTAISTLLKEECDKRSVYSCFAQLYCAGYIGDFSAVNGNGKLIPQLPKYGWDRQEYWITNAHNKYRRQFCRHPLLSNRLPSAIPTWQTVLDHHTHSFISGQRYNDEHKLPNGVLLELLLSASANYAHSAAQVTLEDISIEDAISLKLSDDFQRLQTIVTKSDTNHQIVKVLSEKINDQENEPSTWAERASARISQHRHPRQEAKKLNCEEIISESKSAIEAEQFYQKLKQAGFEFEPSNRVIESIHLSNSRVFAVISKHAIEESASPTSPLCDLERYTIHPCIFEAIEQASRALLGAEAAHATLGKVSRLSLNNSDSPVALINITSYPKLQNNDGNLEYRLDIDLADVDGNVIGSVQGACFNVNEQGISEEFQIPENPQEWLYQYQWLNIPHVIEDDEPVSNRKGQWLLFSDNDNIGGSLRSLLEKDDNNVISVTPASSFNKINDSHYAIDPTQSVDFAKLINEAFIEKNQDCEGIIYLWPLLSREDAIDSIESVSKDLDNYIFGAVNLIRTLSQAKLKGRPRLYLVTAGSQQVETNQSSLSLTQSAIWGLAKGIALEHPELQNCRIDLPLDYDAACVDLLHEEIMQNSEEDQIAFRDNNRFVARLAYKNALEEQPQRLNLGELSELTLSSEINIDAYSLLFKKQNNEIVINTAKQRRGSLTDHDIEIQITDLKIDGLSVRQICQRTELEDYVANSEFVVGFVSRVGNKVTSLSQGQRVISLNKGKLCSHLIADENHAVALPCEIDIESIFPYCRELLLSTLVAGELFNIQRGDTLFIHGADTAIGLLFLQIARRMGARIFVSSSGGVSDDELNALHVKHIFDANNSQLFSQVGRLTNEKGVDTFVNCIPDFNASKAQPALSAFAKYTDLTSSLGIDEQLATVVPLLENVSNFNVNIESVLKDSPTLIAKALTLAIEALDYIDLEVLSELHGSVQSLSGTQTTLLNEPAHLTVSLPQQRDAQSPLSSPYREDITYLITGGLGGLGLKIAERMANNGAKHLLLVGRSAPSLMALDLMAKMRQKGVTCKAVSVDVADTKAVADMVNGIEPEMPRLGGVIHAAGVLDNGLLAQMDLPAFNKVMPAKVLGAWNLHQATKEMDLDAFVMFSSLASIIGSPGQANYSAANAYLEALAYHRNNAGLAGLTLGWGPWTEVGMAANIHNLKTLAQHGMGMVLMEAGLDLLDDFIQEQQKGVTAVLPMNWLLWSQYFITVAQLPYFRDLIPESAVNPLKNRKKITISMLEKLEPSEQLEKIQEAIHSAICESLKVSQEVISIDASLTSTGLDSIVALEVKNRIESYIDSTVQTRLLLKGSSIRELAKELRHQMLFETSADDNIDLEKVSASSAQEAKADDLLEQIDTLTAEEVESMLNELINDPME